MPSLLERSIASIDARLVLLAPPQADLPAFFSNVSEDFGEHERLMREMQRLRGGVYCGDGAIARHELKDGRHQTAEDERSWHLLMLDSRNHVDACIWYMEHPNTSSVHDLRVRNCPLIATSPARESARAAVVSELRQARRERIAYAEVGGWAVSERSRCTPESLMLILATFSLSRVLGGALGLATATMRHSSAAILRRLGLSQLEIAGLDGSSYFDAKYGCEMELLRFDTRRSSEKYDGLIEQLKARLSAVTVIAPSLVEVSVPARRIAVGAAA